VLIINSFSWRLSANFKYGLNFYGGVAWQSIGTERRAGRESGIAEYVAEQLGCTIDDARLIVEVRAAIDEAPNLQRLHDTIEIAIAGNS
jgi:hypothetical protein